ncbi:MAG: RsmD family RNA methyltransferase [Planctomycetota bacterium]|nr:RsmD family RNA methyltransferase [Planctomycetota bacterium]
MSRGGYDGRMRIGAGRFKGRALPPARDARPVPGRLRTSLFNALAPHLDGAHVLDLCAGVGGLGLEALSRGAAHVTLVDRDRGAVRALAAWIDAAGADDEAEALQADVLEDPLPLGPYDLVLADPPFAFWEDERGATLIARALGVLAQDGRLVLKLPANLPFEVRQGAEIERRRAMGSVAYLWLRRA